MTAINFPPLLFNPKLIDFLKNIDFEAVNVTKHDPKKPHEVGLMFSKSDQPLIIRFEPGSDISKAKSGIIIEEKELSILEHLKSLLGESLEAINNNPERGRLMAASDLALFIQKFNAEVEYVGWEVDRYDSIEAAINASQNKPQLESETSSPRKDVIVTREMTEEHPSSANPNRLQPPFLKGERLRASNLSFVTYKKGSLFWPFTGLAAALALYMFPFSKKDQNQVAHEPVVNDKPQSSMATLEVRMAIGEPQEITLAENQEQTVRNATVIHTAEILEDATAK